MDEKNSVLELMKNCISNLKPVIDVDSVVGSPVEMPNGDKVFPLVKISVGYVAGGGEYANKKLLSKKVNNLPFAGGSSSGCSAEPIGFFIAKKSGTQLVTLKSENAFADISKKAMDAFMCFVKQSGKTAYVKVKKSSEKNKNAEKGD